MSVILPLASGAAKGVSSNYFPTIQSTVNTVSAAYTILTTDGYSTILVNTSGADRQINLPAASSNTGRIITIKKTDTGTFKVNIARAGSDLIDTGTSSQLADYGQYITLISDGTNWSIIASSGHSVTGTAQTSTGSVTSTTMAVLTTNNPTLTFRAMVTGKYKTSIVGVFNTSNNTVQAQMEIDRTAGSGTTIFNQTAEQDVPTAGLPAPFTAYRIDTLTAGVDYTFDFKAKVNTGSVTLNSNRPENGIAIISERIG